METGISNWKDILEVVVWVAGASSLVYAAFAYHATRKQLNFAVIVSCTERFQKIMPKLKEADSAAIRQYIDLCHEELFYFKHGYLPKEIIDEWLDGMVYYLPHFDGMPNLNSEEKFLLSPNDPLLHDYPRIRYTFSLTDEYKIADSSQRRQLVKELKKRLVNFAY